MNLTSRELHSVRVCLGHEVFEAEENEHGSIFAATELRDLLHKLPVTLEQDDDRLNAEVVRILKDPVTVERMCTGARPWISALAGP